MDMDRQLLHQLLHLSPQEHFMAGFFAVDGGYSAHFQTGEFIEPVGVVAAGIEDGGEWMEDLMQLGDELFGGGGVVSAAGTGDDHDDGGGGSGSPDGPPPSVSPPGSDGSPPPSGELASERRHREEDGGGASPVTTTRKRRDRSKTIVSERTRRVRMKEKLYELRSLVPNITKMDKASIIADAVVYIRNLQVHARKLREEVAALEARPRSPSSLSGPGRDDQHGGGRAAAAAAGRRHHRPAAGARLSRVGVVQVGHGRFFVTVECERRDGVAAPLCAAAESLVCFRVESSSLARSGPDRVMMSTLTLKLTEQVGNVTIGEGSVKHWVMAALLKQGFRP